MTDLAEMNDGTVTLTSPSFAAASLTGDLSFSDNDKAIFGAGNDLQIYHDGNNSIIKDAGTGSLVINTNTFQLANAANTETILNAVENGAVTLYYDNATKLATTSTGIDVTGTVTADGVELSGTSVNLTLFETDQTDLNTRFRQTAGDIYIQTIVDDSSSAKSRLGIDHATGDIFFYEDTGTTAKLFWDASAERLGIGTTSPREKLDVIGDVIIESAYDGTQFIRNVDVASAGLAGHYIGIGAKYNGNPVTPVVLAGSTDSDGTAGSFSIRLDDSEKMRIDSSGRVGIGTSAPFSDSLLTLGSAQGTSQSIVLNGFGSDGESAITNTNANLIFSTGYGITVAALTERMRIDGSGFAHFNTGGSQAGATVSGTSIRSLDILKSTNTTSGFNQIVFYNPNGAVGTIRTTGSSTAYNTSSDYRLKENVTGITDGIERVKQLNPSRFNFIADADTTVDGFLAHEAATVVPEAVTGEKDAVDEDGNPEYQGIDQAKLVPLLTAALQEAITKIEDLEARVATLEGN